VFWFQRKAERQRQKNRACGVLCVFKAFFSGCLNWWELQLN
jgi:hypothetical protein